MDLVLWLLTAIPQHDEETITVHVPLMAARILKGIVSSWECCWKLTAERDQG